MKRRKKIRNKKPNSIQYKNPTRKKRAQSPTKAPPTRLPIRNHTEKDQKVTRCDAQSPRKGTKEFARLVTEWRKRLQDSGFKDIEYVNPKTYASPSDNTTFQTPRLERVQNLAEKGLHFDRIKTFVTHNERWGKTKFDNLVARLYADGLSYRKILKATDKARCRQMRRRGVRSYRGLWHVFETVRRLVAEAYAWNKRHPMGVDYDADV